MLVVRQAPSEIHDAYEDEWVFDTSENVIHKQTKEEVEVLHTKSLQNVNKDMRLISECLTTGDTNVSSD